jgi:hypothetical protein
VVGARGLAPRGGRRGWTPRGIDSPAATGVTEAPVRPSGAGVWMRQAVHLGALTPTSTEQAPRRKAE